MTVNRELTPEDIPSTEAQAEALYEVCDELVGRSPFGRPPTHTYDENFIVTFPPLIDRHFSELSHTSEVTQTIGRIGLGARIETGHIRRSEEKDFSLTLKRTQDLARGSVYLNTVIGYEIGLETSRIERKVEYNVFTNSPVTVLDIDRALIYSAEHDHTLHQELVALEKLADQSTVGDRVARLRAALLGPHDEERNLGLFAVSFAEADELINLISGIK